MTTRLRAEPLSAATIEQRAHCFRSQDLGIADEPVDGSRLADFLEMNLVERFDVDLQLVAPGELCGEGCVGPYQTHDGEDRIALSLPEDVFLALVDDQPRAKATATHELGHLLCGHHHIQRRSIEQATVPALFRQGTDAVYTDPEWQAWEVSHAVLMPLRLVRALHQELGGACDADLEAAVVARFKVSAALAGNRVRRLRKRGLLN